jgi:glutamine amidotransferase
MNNNILVCILDYGSGNVKSVKNLIDYLGFDCLISNVDDDIIRCTHLILPGVGSYGAAMENIFNRIPIGTLEFQVLVKKKPFLGICVGMQVLSNFGKEFGFHKGLGWIDGFVDKVDSLDLPLPHIGWNDVNVLNDCQLFNGLNDNLDFYFVHSYKFAVDDKSVVTSEVDYGTTFCSSLQKGNIFGVQFHPEKSQKSGQVLMNNFLNYNEKI